MTKYWGSKKWHTWVNHGLIAAAVTYLFSFVVSPREAALMAVAFYLFREVNQQRKRILRGDEMFWLDSIMDVVAPAVTAGLVWWWRI